MRILLSAYACEPNRGSEPGIGWNWAYHLAKSGYTIHLLTRPHGRDAIEKELTKEPLPNLFVHYVDVPRWSKHYLKGQFGVYAHYLLWQKEAFKFARTLYGDVDLIHHVSWGSLHGGSHLWKIGLPFVFGPVGGGQVAPMAFRDVFDQEWPREHMRTVLTKLLPYIPALRNMLSKTHLVLATNQETADLARRMGARRVELFLDTGLPESFFTIQPSNREPSKELKMLWIGRIYARKALPLAFLAMRKALDLGVPVRLTVVGDGPLGFEVPAWIRQHGLEDRVEWWGQVPWDEVRKAYASHDVLLFTSLRDSFGSQLLEAMAFGLPVVTLDHHGAKAFVPEGAGIKVPVIDPGTTAELLANALRELWMDPVKRVDFGKTGYDFARSQTWTKRVEVVGKLYASLQTTHRNFE